MISDSSRLADVVSRTRRLWCAVPILRDLHQRERLLRLLNRLHLGSTKSPQTWTNEVYCPNLPYVVFSTVTGSWVESGPKLMNIPGRHVFSTLIIAMGRLNSTVEDR
uniref:(northern house mosquito) hypothetical protein n=1 Tax=Culex pipiens TaxID=7175 RepID=A0A8D8ASZ2_CULPI